MHGTCGQDSVRATGISRKRLLAAWLGTHSGSTRSHYTAPTTLPPKPSKLPWGLLLLILIVSAWATVAGVVWLLMQAADQVRGMVT